jgi:hypothetical protein
VRSRQGGVEGADQSLPCSSRSPGASPVRGSAPWPREVPALSASPPALPRPILGLEGSLPLLAAANPSLPPEPGYGTPSNMPLHLPSQQRSFAAPFVVSTIPILMACVDMSVILMHMQSTTLDAARAQLAHRKKKNNTLRLMGLLAQDCPHKLSTFMMMPSSTHTKSKYLTWFRGTFEHWTRGGM